MKELYGELYDALAFGYDWTKDGTSELAVFAPVIGRHYEEHRDVRLMWVGRAVNGWLPISRDTGRAEFVRRVLREAEREGRYDFLWKRSGRRADRPDYTRSAFWATSKRVCERLMPETAERGAWVEHLVWANLYAAAPVVREERPAATNPNGTLRRAQQDVCEHILKTLVERTKPTHIVFVTGWDWWFADFSHLMAGVRRLAGADDPKDPIDGKGMVDGCKVVVAKRPDRRFAYDLFADAVCEALYHSGE